jgi:imidazole glycerol-phosphate synthase subunit HisH
MRVVLFDYGAGNLHSLSRALVHLGHTVQVTTDVMTPADLLVLPGVGAFGLAAERLAPARDALRHRIAEGQALLGICLGMQLLFDGSEEDPSTENRGIGAFAGRVTRLGGRRVPHIGWSRLSPTGQMMYFAHAYVCRPQDPTIVRATAMHEEEVFPAMVRRERVGGVQFHPEKSSRDGLDLLAELVTEVAS